jgi:hypothetical protein
MISMRTHLHPPGSVTQSPENGVPIRKNIPKLDWTNAGSLEDMPIQPAHLETKLTTFLSVFFPVVMHPVPHALNPEVVDVFKQMTHDHDLVSPATNDLYTFETRRVLRSEKDHRLTPSDTAYLDEMDRNEAYFHKAYAIVTVNRILFATEKGILGLGLKSDQVWLVKDSRMLLTVRPQRDGIYTLVGETYLAGAMNGEFVDCAKDQWKELKLV